MKSSDSEETIRKGVTLYMKRATLEPTATYECGGTVALIERSCAGACSIEDALAALLLSEFERTNGGTHSGALPQDPEGGDDDE